MLLDQGRVQLSLIRRRALRMGVWFRVLSRVERALVDLTIRCVDRVRSNHLACALVKVLAKLLGRVRSRFLRKVEESGRRVAEKLSDTAVSWGNEEAVKWRYDLSFIRLVGLNYLSATWK